MVEKQKEAQFMSYWN